MYPEIRRWWCPDERPTKITPVLQKKFHLVGDTCELVNVKCLTLEKVFLVNCVQNLECCVVYYRVLVLENGQVREFDSPATLLSNRNSQFYSLAEDAGLV